jgi:hypothetical protein
MSFSTEQDLEVTEEGWQETHNATKNSLPLVCTIFKF